jgi:hypothetical protein
MDLRLEGGELAFEAPGDDLLCGTADAYELATSDQPIAEDGFDDAEQLTGSPEPVAPGETQTLAVPPGASRYLAVRAVDEQGNVGRVATIDFGPGTLPGPPATPGPGANPPVGGGPGGSGSGGACANAITGTQKRDRLRGSAGADSIRGRGGRDRIDGRGGADCLFGQGAADRVRGGAGADELRGGRGRDKLKGGAGDDVIRARRGARDRIDCGPGNDVAYINDRRDRVRRCERVRAG